MAILKSTRDIVLLVRGTLVTSNELYNEDWENHTSNVYEDVQRAAKFLIERKVKTDFLCQADLIKTAFIMGYRDFSMRFTQIASGIEGITLDTSSLSLKKPPQQESCLAG